MQKADIIKNMQEEKVKVQGPVVQNSIEEIEIKEKEDSKIWKKKKSKKE